MNRIGTLDIIDSRSYIVPATESIWLSVNVQGWLVQLNIVFEPLAAVHGIRIESQAGHARVIFANWCNSLGTATTIPAQLGRHSNGRMLFFMATHYMIGDDPARATVKFDIQFLLGAAA